MTSKVFFTDFRVKNKSILIKLDAFLKTAGLDSVDFDGKYVAVKMHFGEPGNLAFLRPNYAKTVCDFVKQRGGKPFLTDCNTLYVGGRKNGLDHLDSAYQNGFNPFQTGVHTVIADGIKGTDEVYVPVKGGVYVKEAKIGRAVMDADYIISLNHFKGHEAAGFGGALKNIGMGCGSRAGKMEMHSAGKPFVRSEKCINCKLCATVCAHSAISFENKASIDESKCVGCGRCVGICPKDAVRPRNDESNEILGCKIAEYSKAILDKIPSFHISFVCDVSPNCDCHSENDAPIVPDVGIFASFDPVAIDAACADAVNNQIAVTNSLLGKCEHTGDHFSDLHPTTDWRAGLLHAEKLGIGIRNYELVEMKQQ